MSIPANEKANLNSDTKTDTIEDKQKLKTTPFYHIHQQLGAKIVPFAGFLMPVEYSGINDEHLAVRSDVGIFDVSHMGEIWVKGKNALDLIQWVTSNDASKLVPGKIQYSCFPNGKGGIVDDLLVYKFTDEKYLLVVNASNIEKDWKWVQSQNKFGAELENSSDSMAQVAVQGPNATKILQRLTSMDLKKMNYYTFQECEFAGVKNVLVSATGYTGAGGFEIYFRNEDYETIWNAVFYYDNQLNVKPIGLGARDTLRLEMGYCLYGNDIDDTTSPIEAGLDWITKFTPHKNFIDKQYLENQLTQGVKRKLSGFRMIDRGIPRHDYVIKNKSGATIGKVTSGTMSPVLKQGIGMGYVSSEFALPGSEIFIEIRDKLIKAEITSLPFIHTK
jgi:aminomethyltransferase